MLTNNVLKRLRKRFESVMENYIKNGGDPYGVENYMDKVFERLGDMGFDGQE